MRSKASTPGQLPGQQLPQQAQQSQQSQQPQQQQQQQQQTQHVKPPRILACVLCQHRKIKCDRNMPCSNCLKANVPCSPSTPAPVRKRRRPNQDLQERLARCEALLKQYASAGPLPNLPNNLADSPTASSVGSTAASASAAYTFASSSNSIPVPSLPGLHPLAPSPRPQTAQTTLSSNVPTPHSPAGMQTPSASLHEGDDPSGNLKRPGKLVVQDGSVTFVDSIVWRTIHENLQAMRAIVDAEAVEEQSPLSSSAVTPDDNVDLLLNDFSAIELEDVAPSPVQVFRLWQVFLERINPLTKLVHVPSLQPLVIEAAANHRNVPNNIQCLLFAIYLVCTVSLSESECRQMLDTSKDEALKTFTAGVKSALTRVNFMKHYDMVTLQALVLYLISLQGRYDRHAAWVLSGVLIRIAYKMGLHRDGEKLNLPPFETEMRRRVWWQIIMLDCKYAITSGFADTLLPWGWDTEIPTNIDDSSLFRGSTEPIQPREGPTEMIFCIMFCEIGRFISRNRMLDTEEAIFHTQGADPDSPEYAAAIEILATQSAVIDKLEARLIEIEQRYLDTSAGPIHVAASFIRPGLLGRLRSMITPMRQIPEWGTEVRNVHDNIFRIFVCHEESNLAYADMVNDRNYRWFFTMHCQVDIIIYLATMLHKRPATGSLADRTWRLFDKVYEYHEELLTMTQKPHLQLAHLILKTWPRREQALAQLGAPCEPPVCVNKLRQILPRLPADLAATLSSRPGTAKPGNNGNNNNNNNNNAMATTDNGAASEMQMDFLNGFFDPLASDWDPWPEMGPSSDLGATINPQAASDLLAFGGLGNFGAPPPHSTW
ncbi:hypothetical protein SODALDRAFT_149802 [Sodiomyces alkalinus F11]|uniref:Zn(2)-C6 fungal-type domain-containing protein n=1 Tax=Sodiomyces alkalinus (strain CBS 110278 / VKM F-3762 / F11) TaxID=1314773 RepID=A0A3N2PX35_SODAK|nr:hypothetical protein SODALDRAFT_149802 [Sodiomyces alkalinus F11]ROT38976.1 hypothetical protein SODALDRAFT_149802 [Sodiomyces alkalinus F11]